MCMIVLPVRWRRACLLRLRPFMVNNIDYQINIITRTIRMDALFKNYKELVALFYRKTISDSKRKAVLTRKFHYFQELIDTKTEQRCKETKSITKSNLGSSRSIDNQLKKSTRSKSNLDDKSSVNSNKMDDRKLFGCEWIFSAKSYKKMVVFAVLFILISLDNSSEFKLIEENINEVLEQSTLNHNTLQVISFEWSKLSQILFNRKKLRWEKVLSETTKKFPSQFDHIFFQFITKLSLPTDESFSKNIDRIFTSLSAAMKVKVNFFTVKGKRLSKIERFGEGNYQIALGFLEDSQQFVMSNKLPVPSEDECSKQKLIAKMTFNISEIIGEFEANEAIISDIDSLSIYKPSEGKLLEMFENRK